jgi:hypothetical protein
VKSGQGDRGDRRACDYVSSPRHAQHAVESLDQRPLRHHAKVATQMSDSTSISACPVVELSDRAHPPQRVGWHHLAHLSVACRWRCYQVPRTPPRQSCARSAPCPDAPCRAPRLHHAKRQSGLHNLLGSGTVSLVLRPNVPAPVAGIELDRQVGRTFQQPSNLSASRADWM